MDSPPLLLLLCEGDRRGYCNHKCLSVCPPVHDSNTVHRIGVIFSYKVGSTSDSVLKADLENLELFFAFFWHTKVKNTC